MTAADCGGRMQNGPGRSSKLSTFGIVENRIFANERFELLQLA